MTILLREAKEGVAVLTLNRPEKLNAFNYALVDALGSALDDFEADRAVRAVILTGAGERAFSAGADIAEFAGSVEAGVERADAGVASGLVGFWPKAGCEKLTASWRSKL